QSVGGTHTLAIVPGGASAGGSGSIVQPGIGTRGSGVHRPVPADVHVLTHPRATGAGRAPSYAAQDSQLYAWGSNDRGQLGDGNQVVAESSPKLLDALAGVLDMKAGDHHVLALLEDGSVYSWGNNPRGQLGNGTMTEEHMYAP